MRSLISRSVLSIFLFLALVGCSSRGLPVTPSPTLQSTVSEPSSTAPTSDSHRLWSLHLIYVNPATLDFEVIPLRDAAIHFNVLGWLENPPCSGCFKITHIVGSGTGTILVTVQIKHPYMTANLTGFDVRGIAMFNAGHKFPASSLTLSDRSLGDQALVNPDGFTTLYNPTTVGKGPDGLQGYIKGDYASATFPSGLLNGFKRFDSEGMANKRDAFYAKDTISVTYELSIPPTPFAFGYAVDASWAPPIKKPVEDPMTDFGPEANCPEAWKIDVKTESAYTMTNCQGKLELNLDIYDHQGVDNTHLPKIECPELFDGAVQAWWVVDTPDFTRYQYVISNVKNAPVGTYRCLVSKEAVENDPVGKPWLNLTAYQVIPITVFKDQKKKPTAAAEANKQYATLGEPVFFDASASHDNDCNNLWITKYEWDWENNGDFVEGPAMTSHSWDTEGVHEIQLSVIDDEGASVKLDWPLQVSVSSQAFDPVDVTPPWLNFRAEDVCVDGNRMYVAGGFGLHIFDLTNPTAPTWEGWAITPGPAHAVAASGNYAFVTNDYHGLEIIDVTNPLFAHVAKEVDKSQANDIAVSDGYAFTTAGGPNANSLYIIDIDPIESACVVTTVKADLHGGLYGVTVSDGLAYVAHGTNGVQVIDVSPPEAASTIKTIDTAGDARDVVVSGGYAYVADYNSRLQVVDIDPLDAAHVVWTVATPGNTLNLAISGEYVYAACQDGGIAVFDVHIPESAALIKTIPVPGEAMNVTTSGKYAYVADSAAGVPILDISTPPSALMVAIKDTTSSIQASYPSGDYAYVAAGGAGLEIVDVQPPALASIVKSVDTPGSARNVVESGGYAYVADSDALNIIDVDPPANAHSVKTVPASSSSYNMCLAVADGYAYLHCGTELDIIDINPVNSAYLAATVPLPSTQYGSEDDGVAVAAGYAYVTNCDNGLQIIDIDPPETAHIVHAVPPPVGWDANDVAVSGNYAYMAVRNVEIDIINIESPESAYVMRTIPSDSPNWLSLAISGGYMYGADGGVGLNVFDVSPPESAFKCQLIDLTQTSGGPYDVFVSENYAYLACNPNSTGGGFRILKLW